MPTVSIIETGLVPEELRGAHGSYPDMFQRMLSSQDTLEFAVVHLCDGESLPAPDEVDAVLITGSAAGVYDAIDWIAPLEAFVRSVHARGIPMVGVCFGHQLIAQALGGTVRKVDKGWGIGRHVYDVAPGNGLIDAARLAVPCSHQDQVVVAPPDAATIMSSDFAPHAGLLYGNGTTLTVQPHPEFDAAYALTRCEARAGHAPDDVVATGIASLDKPLDSDRLGTVIGRFLAR